MTNAHLLFFTMRAAVALLVLFAAQHIFAQCFCNGAECLAAGRQGNLPSTAVAYELPDKTRFKIKVETVVNSSPNNSNDWVQFTIIENVYGLIVGRPGGETSTSTRTLSSTETETDSRSGSQTLTDGAMSNVTKVSSESVKKTETRTEQKFEPVSPPPAGLRYVVIPVGTKAYGQVYSARGRSPFWIKGKAQIFVVLTHIKLESGHCVPVEFADANLYENILPCEPESREARKKLDGPTKSAPKSGLQCIAGRRPKTAPAGAFLSAITAGLLGVTKDDLSYPVAGALIIDKTAGNSGILDFVNGVNAEVSDKWIFEVQTKQMVRGYAIK